MVQEPEEIAKAAGVDRLTVERVCGIHGDALKEVLMMLAGRMLSPGASS